MNNPYTHYDDDEYEDDEFEDEDEYFDDNFDDRKRKADELYKKFQERERRYNSDDAIEFGLNWAVGLIIVVVIVIALFITGVVLTNF